MMPQVTANKKNETCVPCSKCKLVNIFHQPYPYHAGFGNQGFLYDNAGTLTLTWSAYDAAYVALIGGKNPWVLTAEDQTKLENNLLPAPSGGQWRFCNPPRCCFCGHPIGDPIGRNVYYFFYDGSIDADNTAGKSKGLVDYLQPKA